jgi:hypothetical protein
MNTRRLRRLGTSIADHPARTVPITNLSRHRLTCGGNRVTASDRGARTEWRYPGQGTTDHLARERRSGWAGFPRQRMESAPTIVIRRGPGTGRAWQPASNSPYLVRRGTPRHRTPAPCHLSSLDVTPSGCSLHVKPPAGRRGIGPAPRRARAVGSLSSHECRAHLSCVAVQVSASWGPRHDP